MGTWGTGLYQDDVACDVKESIKDKLTYGNENGEKYTKEELIKSIFEEYKDCMQFEDDRDILILVLADMLWQNGMLTDEIKKEAVKIIEQKSDLERWKEDKKLYQKREKVLESLKEKIESKQPKEKVSKIKKRAKPYVCPWKIGDRFAYELKSEKAKEYGLEGRYLILSVVRPLKWGDSRNVWYLPVMRIQITKGNKIPTTYEEIENCEYIIDGYDAEKEKYRYTTIIADKITLKVQKMYKFIGNFPVAGWLEDGYIDNGIPIWLTWYKLDDYEIENYIKFGTNRNKKLIKENFKNEEEEDRIVEFGHGFFQNDVTMHTATKYIYLLNIFENNEQATNKLIEYNKNIIEDKERAPLFWIALANVQWDYGRLLKNVKEKAIQCIESGDKIEKWKKELEKVKKKLNSKQPAKKKIEKIIKLKTPNWKKGDILLYQIRNKELKEHKWYNKYVLLQVIGMKKTEISYLLPDEFYDEEEIIVLYNWIGNHQIDLNKISELKTIFFKDEEKIYGRELKFFGLYHLSEEELKKVSIKVIKNDMNNLNTKELKLMYPFMYIYHLDDFEFAIIEALEREEKRGNLVKDL